MTDSNSTTPLNYKLFTPEDKNAQKQKPLFILHGLLGSQDNWRTQAKRLSKNQPVITLDLRNHGNSPHIKGMSYREMYEDLIELALHLEIPRFHLLGHSMGGKVAMQMALSRPEFIISLIIVDIAPRPYPLWHQHMLGTILKAPVDTMQSRQEVDDYLSECIEDPIERSFMIKNLKRTDTGFEWKCNLEEISRNYLKIAGFSTANQKFTATTLFISGENSNYIGDSDTTLIELLFPGSTIVTIKDSGHLPHFQQADIFYEEIEAFLAG